MREKVGELVKAITEREQSAEDIDYLVDFVAERLNAFTNYFNSVYNNVIMSEMSTRLRDSGRITQEEFERRLVNSDKTRRYAHETAIDACHQLNRLCDSCNVPKFCPDTDDRYVIADFIGEFVSEIYQEGQSKTLDKAIDKAEKENRSGEQAYKKLTKEDLFNER